MKTTALPKPQSIAYTCVAIACLFLLGGCGTKTTPQTAGGNLSPYKVSSYSQLSQVEKDVAYKLNASYYKWKGTPYRYGGNSSKGIDCSAFSQQVYREVFKRNLPRTAAQQATTGRTVKKDKLNPGDLIFFKQKGRIDHVGVYTSNGYFIHASSSNGVMRSHLNNVYWRQHYYTARTHWR